MLYVPYVTKHTYSAREAVRDNIYYPFHMGTNIVKKLNIRGVTGIVCGMLGEDFTPMDIWGAGVVVGRHTQYTECCIRNFYGSKSGTGTEWSITGEASWRGSSYGVSTCGIIKGPMWQPVFWDLSHTLGCSRSSAGWSEVHLRGSFNYYIIAEFQGPAGLYKNGLDYSGHDSYDCYKVMLMEHSLGLEEYPFKDDLDTYPLYADYKNSGRLF